MALSDTSIRNAKPRAAGYRLSDEGGLHLFVLPSGVRSWRWRYTWQGREKTLVIGRYPDVSLADARSRRDDARRTLAHGRDPAVVPVAATSPTFETVARAWHATNAPRWKPHHAADVLSSLADAIFPAFGGQPIAEVTALDVLTALRAVEQRGAIETARRIKQRVSAVFAYALGEGVVQSDPARDVGGALAPLPVKGHRPALSSIADARAALIAVEDLTGQPVARLAHRFLALTAQRPSEVGGMAWSELEGDLWRIPAARMKMHREHLVPMTPAALDVLAAVRGLTGDGRLVFPNLWTPNRPMSVTALSHLLIRAGYRDRLVPHGWRATFSTVMNEAFPADRAVIDLMLAHLPAGAVERAYNRAQHMERRRELAEAWARMLCEGLVPARELVGMVRRG